MYKTMKPLRATAYDRFVDLLAKGKIPPGAIVSQRDLVAATDMPLGAVREMIPRLEAEGLIETVPKRGLQVPELREKMINDVFIMRRLIEREAFLLLCRVAEPAWLAGSVAAHRVLKADILGQTGSAGEPGETLVAFPKDQTVDQRHRARFAELGRELHQTAIDALANETLATVYRANSVKVGMIRSQTPSLSKSHVVEMIDEHLAILFALQARNSGRTAGAVQAHLESAKRRASVFAPDPDGGPMAAALSLGAA